MLFLNIWSRNQGCLLLSQGYLARATAGCADGGAVPNSGEKCDPQVAETAAWSAPCTKDSLFTQASQLCGCSVLVVSHVKVFDMQLGR